MAIDAAIINGGGYALIQKTEFPNGLTLLSEDIAQVRSVAIGIWVNVGSRDEMEELGGVSHFIEHLLFKGTEKRSAKQIAEALDAVGGHLNAFTTKECTCYYAKVLDEHFPLALDVLTDMLFESKFSAEDIDRERNVILEEIKMYEDAPDELVHDIFAATLWEGHVLGKPIIGQEDIIRSVDRETILAYYRQYYVPRNMVIAVAGHIDHEVVKEAVWGAFAQQSGVAPIKNLLLPEPKIGVSCKNKDTEQIHLCIGAPGLPLGHENIYVFQLLNTILGGGISSRLFQEIREQRGLVYSVYSYHSSYHDSGVFCIYAGLSKQNVEPALSLILGEIEKVLQHGVTADELGRAKEQTKGNLLLSLESVNTRMSRMGKSQLYLGKVLPPEEVLSKVEQVSQEDILALANAMLTLDKFSIASVGPWDDCELLKTALRKRI